MSNHHLSMLAVRHACGCPQAELKVAALTINPQKFQMRFWKGHIFPSMVSTFQENGKVFWEKKKKNGGEGEIKTYFGEVRDNCTSPHISSERHTTTESSTSYLIFFYMSQFEMEPFHLKSIN